MLRAGKSAAGKDKHALIRIGNSLPFVDALCILQRIGVQVFGGRPQGRPRLGASAPSRRSTVTSLPKTRGLSPVNGSIQEGSDAVITPATDKMGV